MQSTTWADTLNRYIEGRLMDGRELAALFEGTGVASEPRRPDDIFRPVDVIGLELIAARLAATVDVRISEGDWIFAALKFRDDVLDLLAEEKPAPKAARYMALAFGMLADLAVGMMRAGRLAPLEAIEPPKMSREQIEAMLHDVAERSVAQDRRSRDATTGRDS